MPAVSDSSPLILFARIGALDLLHALFGEIFIARAVRAEIVAEGSERPGAAEIVAAPWITPVALTHSDDSGVLMRELGAGEAESVMLAEQLGGRMPLLIDDLKGRRLARARGLPLLGSAGVGVLAKERGAIPLLRPLLDRLRAAGLYLGDAAYREALAAAGELPKGSEESPS